MDHQRYSLSGRAGYDGARDENNDNGEEAHDQDDGEFHEHSVAYLVQ